MADPLATESIRGNVLVRSGTALHTSIAAARADPATTKGVPVAMRVIRDHGDVVELSTAPADDCASSFDQPYELTVFVKRGMLYARAKADIVKMFPDGTGVAIDRGAAVEVSPQGAKWVAAAFAETPVAPVSDRLVYGVPAKLKPAELPPLAGERLICDRGGPMTKQAWSEQRRREREIEERAEVERRKQAQAVRRAQLEREREERARKKATQPRKKLSMEQQLEEDMANRMADLVFDDDSRSDLVGAALDAAYAPNCGVVDTASHSMSSRTPATKPKINGVSVSFPTYASPVRNDHVVQQSNQYLGEIAYRCGRTRVLVERDGVGSTGGSAALGGGGQVKLWIPKAGRVTWSDGRPAGTYKGTKRYANVVEKDDRICVTVGDVAELVCHAKKTTATEMGSRYGTD